MPKELKMKDGEYYDVSGYSEVWTRPKRAFAKRIRERKEYDAVVNGCPTSIVGRPGDYEVVFVNSSGQFLKVLPFSEEDYTKKFGSAGVDGDLFSYAINEDD